MKAAFFRMDDGSSSSSRLRVAALAVLLVGASGAASAVDPSKYGIGDEIARVAQCVVTKLPSSASNNVVHMYWNPPTVFNGECTRLRDELQEGERQSAKTSFLTSLSQCVGKPIRDDSTNWVLQVGDATSILSAAGIRDALTGASLLDRLNAGAHRCLPQ